MVLTETVEPVAPTPTVAQLLALSQRAHITAQACRAKRDFIGHLQCLSEALERRLEADLLDPDHSDVAWAEESAVGRKARFLHADVIAFYRKELGIAPEAPLQPVRAQRGMDRV